MRRLIAAALLLTAAPALAGQAAPTPQSAAFLRQHGEAMSGAINHPSRKEDRARDAYRHPAETLAFWQIAPDMTVGEYAPGGQWFSRLLGHYLGGEGQLVGLFFSSSIAPDDAAKARLSAAAAKFPADVAGFTGLAADRFRAYTLDSVPADQKGTFDRIIVPRMMHNLVQRGVADSELLAMRALLKDDGMLGIEQHRAKADAPFSYANGSKGYMRQKDVIALVEAHGFELVGTSEINANPRDTANHAEGVWEMPPVLRTKREDLKGLGESDRMTLLFRKRP
ncbi:class I SAM-dependent methyltransferase [Qipengyuania sediminis]|uniref:class I SAM-dependent methyltransferase n=1 Tax=Qipengyuania sediminis TaxID=1532023 RepID=UPI00105A3F15|nr:class I SAM-dependent methyltransferase [Qipengyuania sediminis]